MIPRIIHYIWVGSALPEKNKEIVEEWQKLMPDYTFMFWGNELMKDCNVTFVKQAWRKKCYAFVSDYFRLQKVYQYGGYYLDTDMKMLKRLDDFEQNAFVVCAEIQERVAWGFFGAEAGNPFLKKCLEKYQKREFDMYKPPVIPYFLNKEVWAYLHAEKESTRCLESRFFYPMPARVNYLEYEQYITPDSYGIHLWDFSWIKILKDRTLSEEIIYRLKGLFKDLLTFDYSLYYFRINLTRIVRLIKK